MKRKPVFQVIVAQNEAGYYVADCPALQACYYPGTKEDHVGQAFQPDFGCPSGWKA